MLYSVSKYSLKRESNLSLSMRILGNSFSRRCSTEDTRHTPVAKMHRVCCRGYVPGVRVRVKGQAGSGLNSIVVADENAALRLGMMVAVATRARVSAE